MVSFLKKMSCNLKDYKAIRIVSFHEVEEKLLKWERVGQRPCV